MNINREIRIAPLVTFQALADHYCQTELLAENKTDKTRKTYRVYLTRWILPKWGSAHLHLIKPIAVEQWLRSLAGLSDGSKAKIRNIMSAVFSHAIRFEIADKNPITPVRQSAKRTKIPVILDAAELHRLFSELGLRERAMIIIEALTGIRRSELMGLKWKDVDFVGGRIDITRSIVDQVIGKCKTETSPKPVVIDEHIAHALIAWRQESMYTNPDDWVWGLAAQERQTAFVALNHHAVLHPAGGKARWHSEDSRLAHLSPHILKPG